MVQAGLAAHAAAAGSACVPRQSDGDCRAQHIGSVRVFIVESQRIRHNSQAAGRAESHAVRGCASITLVRRRGILEIVAPVTVRTMCAVTWFPISAAERREVRGQCAEQPKKERAQVRAPIEDQGCPPAAPNNIFIPSDKIQAGISCGSSIRVSESAGSGVHQWGGNGRRRLQPLSKSPRRRPSFP